MENAWKLSKVTEITDLALTQLPILKVTVNALDLANVTENSKVLPKETEITDLGTFQDFC